jgi:hypothetical protein
MMTTIRLFLRIAIEKVEDWQNDRLFAAWRAKRSDRRSV